MFQLRARPRQDDVSELGAIELRRPHLETVNRRFRHHAAIKREPIAFLGKFLAAMRSTEITKRRDEYLQRGQALLAINHLTPFDMRNRRLLLIEHHRAQK